MTKLLKLPPSSFWTFPPSWESVLAHGKDTAPHRLLTREILSKYPQHATLREMMLAEYGVDDTRPIVIAVKAPDGFSPEMRRVFMQIVTSRLRTLLDTA